MFHCYLESLEHAYILSWPCFFPHTANNVTGTSEGTLLLLSDIDHGIRSLFCKILPTPHLWTPCPQGLVTHSSHVTWVSWPHPHTFVPQMILKSWTWVCSFRGAGHEVLLQSRSPWPHPDLVPWILAKRALGRGAFDVLSNAHRCSFKHPLEEKFHFPS